MTTDCNKLKWIIAGGIIGMLALIGIGVVLIFIAGVICVLVPDFGIYAAKITHGWKFKWFFIAMGNVGFVIGMLGGSRHLQLVQKWFVPVITFSAPVILGLWVLNSCAGYVETPRNVKCTDCINRTTRVNLKVPKGRQHRFMLVVPSGATNSIQGHVRILSGTSILTNFPINSVPLEMRCDFLRTRTDCEVEITFDQQPPPTTAIWLHWLQAYKDR